MVERRAQTTQTSAPWREETHAYPDRRVEAARETPNCTKSTVVVDVVSAVVNTPDKAFSRSFTTAEIASGNPTDEAIGDKNPTERTKPSNEGEEAIDHVYEEVGTVEADRRYEILDYGERRRGQNSRTLVDALSPSHKICAQCASLSGSPVIYTDRLIHGRENIYAKEAILFNPGLSPHQLYFGFRRPGREVRVLDGLATIFGERGADYMPVFALTKANAPGILFSPSAPKDVFDLGADLAPGISLLNGAKNADESNTRLYHRSANERYSRVSAIAGQRPMTFRRIKSSRMFSTVKSTGYDENTINWMNYDNDLRSERARAKGDRDEEQAIVQHNRSSLLLLEPLLLMPEITSTRKNLAKNRITHSEHVKIVRMVIAYTLSFFLLAIITFYIVYFT